MTENVEMQVSGSRTERGEAAVGNKARSNVMLTRVNMNPISLGMKEKLIYPQHEPS